MRPGRAIFPEPSHGRRVTVTAAAPARAAAAVTWNRDLNRDSVTESTHWQGAAAKVYCAAPQWPGPGVSLLVLPLNGRGPGAAHWH